MNRYLSGIDRWNREEIENRFVIISERALKIWAMPDVVLDREMESETNIFDAGDPIYKKLEYAIFLDKKLTVTTVSRLYAEVLQLLFEEHPDAFVDSELGETIGLTNNPIQSKLRQPVPITNTYYIEGNVNNTQKFEKLKQVLTRLDLEEELIVKFDER